MVQIGIPSFLRPCRHTVSSGSRPPGVVVWCVLLITFFSGCLEPQVRYTSGRRSLKGAAKKEPESASVHSERTPTESVAVDTMSREEPEPLSPREQPPSVSRLKSIVDSYLHVPYRYGGMSRKGMDCSGFVNVFYREYRGITLPRTTRQLRKTGIHIPRSSGRTGDLVFFRRNTIGPADHVGVYFGNNRFAHASSKKGVIYSSLENPWYARRFVSFRRIP